MKSKCLNFWYHSSTKVFFLLLLGGSMLFNGQKVNAQSVNMDTVKITFNNPMIGPLAVAYMDIYMALDAPNFPLVTGGGLNSASTSQMVGQNLTSVKLKMVYALTEGYILMPNIRCIVIKNDTNIRKIEICSQNKRAQFLDSLYFSDMKRLAVIKLDTCPKLHTLMCKNDSLTTIDIRHCPVLKRLVCNDNKLTSINSVITASNGALDSIKCSYNSISSLTISSLSKLKYLDCSRNQLSSLNISSCTALYDLNCYGNNLTTLSIPSTNSIKYLYISSNKVKTLDCSNLKNVEILDVSFCELTKLDVSKCTKLKTLYCNSNLFTTGAYDSLMCSLPTVGSGSVYVCNSYGTDSIAFWDANVNIAKNKGWRVYSISSTSTEISTTNGKYVCGLDRSQYITLKFNNTLSVVSLLMKNLSIGVSGTQYVNIVGYNFQSKKVLDTVISINGTQSIKQILQNNNLNNCLELYIYGVVTSLKLDTIPYLTEIDASKNKVLERITGEGDTNLTKINVYGCSKLKEINLVNTKLSTLSLYGCTALETLVLNGGELASLSISGNTALKTLTCSGNKLSTLDISKNTKIETLNISNNTISTLDISLNTALKELSCYGNLFTTTGYDSLMCLLPTRSVSDNAKFYPIENATSANAATFMVANSINAKNKQWAVNYADNNTIPSTSGTFDCNTGISVTVDMTKYITLHVAQNATVSMNFTGNATSTGIKIENGDKDTTWIINNAWTGLFPITANTDSLVIYGAIAEFDCSNNSINKLIVNNDALKTLNCSNNTLTILDVNNASVLENLNCSNNKLTSLDVSNNLSLIKLECYGNSFTTQAYDNLICSLPSKMYADNAKVYPLFDNADANRLAFMGTNAVNNVTPKNWQLLFASNAAPITGTSGTFECQQVVNMNSYITINTAANSPITLSLAADKNNTPIKIVNGNIEDDHIVNTTYSSTININSQTTTITIYGNIAKLDCKGNNANITGLDIRNNISLEELNCADNTISTLDVSRNTSLQTLYCYGNPFTTNIFDEIMCSLPLKQTTDNAKFFPLSSSSDANTSNFMSSNSSNVKAKNWDVLYYNNGTPSSVPATNGTSVCKLDVSSFVVINLINNAQITMEFAAEKNNTTIKISSGTHDSILIIDTNFRKISYEAKENSITIYGKFTKFNCYNNAPMITSLNTNNNSGLVYLNCSYNVLTSLDIRQNTALEELNCANNNLTTIDLSRNIILQSLNCSNNNLGTIDVDKNTQLKNLVCVNTNINTLEITKNTALESLDCSNNNLVSLNTKNNIALKTLDMNKNQLRSLNLSQNNALNKLVIHTNSFTTRGYDSLMCSLPTKNTSENATMLPLTNSIDPNYDVFFASTSKNATNKGWNVLYSSNNSAIPATNGNLDCSELGGGEDPEDPTSISEVNLSNIALYPNPAKTVLNIENATEDVQIFDITGRLLINVENKETNLLQINVSHLSKGMYFVKIGNYTTKFVKE